MLYLLPKDCLDIILSYLFQGIYIKHWDDVEPFTNDEWSKLKEPLNAILGQSYNKYIISLFNIQKILKMAKGKTREGTNLPNMVIELSRFCISNLGNEMLEWKEKKKIYCPQGAELIMNYKWKPSPYHISLNFMNTCKVLRDTYNTESFWNKMYGEHYRNGKKYVRIPHDIKSLYREKVKETINMRYKPVYENILVERERYKENILRNIENRNILLDKLKEINTYNVEDIDNNPQTLNVIVPVTYLANMEMNANNSYRLTLQQTLLRISRHQDEIISKREEYKKLGVIQKRLENFFEKM